MKRKSQNLALVALGLAVVATSAVFNLYPSSWPGENLVQGAVFGAKPMELG